MPSLEELFRTKKLPSGQTAEQTYAVRDSKQLPYSTYNPIINGTVLSLHRAARKKFSDIGRETLIEEESSGLRLLEKVSSPILFGTSLIKLTSKETKDVRVMRNAAKGANSGILSNLVKSIDNFSDKLGSVLGVPQNVIPSKLVNNDKYSNKYLTVADRYLNAQTIANGAGGKFLGKVLANAGSNDLSNVGQKVLGAAAAEGKKALQNKLFGQGKIGLAKNVNSVNSDVRTRRSVFSTGNRKPTDYASQNVTNSQNDILYTRLTAFTNIVPYSTAVTPASIEIEDRNDLSTNFASITKTDIFPEKKLYDRLVNNAPGLPNALQYSKNTSKRYSKILGITEGWEKNALRSGSYTDKVNLSVPYDSPDGKSKTEINGATLDDYDFIPLRFWSPVTKTGANFRATITGLIETFAPSWETQKMIGNPFNFYTYNTHERSVQFNFKVYALSSEELKAQWAKLSFLTGLTYPQSYTSGGAVKPPLIQVTLGSMYKEKDCFIDSIIYTIDDNYNWEIGIGNKDNPNDANIQYYKLPKIVDVAITLKFVESKGSTYGKRKYGYGETINSVANAFEKANSLTEANIFDRTSPK